MHVFIMLVPVEFLMATQVALHGRKRPSAESYSCQDLVRLLVSQVMTSGHAAPSAGRLAIRDHPEEVLLDIDLDGAHYLLIRLPLESPSRVPLSPREQEIVRMVAEGHSNKIIAAVLNISSWTVCTHLRRIFAKLGVGSRAAMVAKTLEENRLWHQASRQGKTTPTVHRAPGSSQPMPAAIATSRKAAPACNQLVSRRAG
jgi:DNA-binding CsgD family transcriptional regulator